MATYVDASDVRPHIGGRPLTSTSSPSQAEVEVWLTELEAELVGTLEAVGIYASTFSSRGTDVLKGWLGKAGAGLLRQAWAAAAGQGSNPDGAADIDAWVKRLEDIRASAEHYRAVLCGATSSGSHSDLRANPCRAPTFTMDDKL